MPRNLKILVNAIPLTGIKTGIGRYIEGLYAELERFPGIEVWYFDGRSVSKNRPQLPRANLRKSLVKIFWKIPSPLALIVRILFHVRRELIFMRINRKFDLYHEPGFFPFRTSIPTVFTIHDLSLLHFPAWHPRERVWYFRLFFKRRLKYVDYIFAVSDFTRKEVINTLNWPSERIRTVYPGYDDRLFYPRPKEEVHVINKKYRLPSRYYLFVGTGDPRKNLTLLEKAAPQFEHPLVVVGWEGWRKPAETASRIIFLGYISDKDLAAIYSGARALIFPSLYEGFGFPALEAMACGCPVILSRKASLPEVGGEAALYLDDPHDPEALLKLLNQLEDPKERFRREELGKIQASKFSWRKAAQESLAIFKEVSR